MTRLCHISLILFIIDLEMFLSHNLDSDVLSGVAIEDHVRKGFDNGDEKTPIYSEWGRWSACQAGRKTRRRHCLRRNICGDSFRIEVARCAARESRRREDSEEGRMKIKVDPKSNQFGHTSVGSWFHIVAAKTASKNAQLWNDGRRGDTDGGVKAIRQRRCPKEVYGVFTMVQLEHMLQKVHDCKEEALPKMDNLWTKSNKTVCILLFGGKLLPSLDTSENAQAKRSRYTVVNFVQGLDYQVESLPTPAPAIHEEDSRSFSQSMTCGRLGRYRASSTSRLRARMQDMVRIIGGRPAPPGKWIWQVAVLNRYKEAFCGGTLVSLRWVVTAAHCIRKHLYVRLGEHDLLVHGYGEVEMRVTEAVIHPQYDPDTVVNDVAMLRLPAPARQDLGHGIACLPNPHQLLAPHTTCVILGWGKKRSLDVHGTRILQEAQVSTIQQGVCRRSYWQYAITDNMVCAGRGRRDSCAGDSGGPLLCRDRSMRYYLQGITSFGDGCGKRGKYGIYTRTANYVPWMRAVMSQNYFDD